MSLFSIEKIRETLEQVELEYKKFDTGNTAAGGRARKLLKEVMGQSKDFWKKIQEERNSRTNK